MTGIITQNVDRLHHKAGSRRVVELHGASAEVICVACRRLHQRDDVQRALLRHNPSLRDRSGEMAPDGDVDLEAPPSRMIVPTCDACSGTLKPHVVFFGESVPAERVERAWSFLDESDVLLVVGSSLAVFSGFRFVRGARERGMPIAIVNLTETRGDPLSTLCVRATAGEVLAQLAARLQ